MGEFRSSCNLFKSLLMIGTILITFLVSVAKSSEVEEASYKEPCNPYADVFCNSDEFLTCENSSCACSANSSYRFDIKQCVGLAGQLCINQKCISNAECDIRSSILISGTQWNGEYGSNPNFNKCECKEGLLTSNEGLCVAPYGDACDNSDELCPEGFKCIDEKCRCPYEGKIKHQKYNDGSGKCITFVGGPCTVPSGNETNAESPCVPHAVCKAKDNDAYKCTCESGFVENAEGGCDLAFGEKCPSEGVQCDQLAQLTCINRKCQCESSLQVYDQTLMRCLGLVGSPCFVTPDKNTSEDCIRGSVCILQRRGKTSHTGICECHKGFKFLSSNRTCEV